MEKTKPKTPAGAIRTLTEEVVARELDRRNSEARQFAEILEKAGSVTQKDMDQMVDV